MTRAGDDVAERDTHPGVLRRISDALHITHHEAPHPPCELAAALLARVKGEMGESFGTTEEKFCDAACLQRYLRARGKDVGKAAAMLKATLEWRRDFGVDKLRLGDYEGFAQEGWIYLAGNDDEGNTMMMLRKRTSRIEEERFDNFIGFLVLLLESGVRNLRPPAERFNWVLDMARYDSRNSPRFDLTLKVVQLLANHYPERLNKVFIVDAPTLFWVLFKAISPFLDHVTRAKIDFVYQKDVQAGASGGPGTVGARFAPYAEFYRTPFDGAKHMQQLAAFGWPQ